MKRAFWSLLVERNLQTSNLSLVGDHKLNKLTHLSNVTNNLSNLFIICGVNLFTICFQFHTFMKQFVRIVECFSQALKSLPGTPQALKTTNLISNLVHLRKSVNLSTNLCNSAPIRYWVRGRVDRDASNHFENHSPGSQIHELVR